MGLNNRLEEIENKFKQQEEEELSRKEKKFKIPFGKKISKVQAKKNYITVVKMNENGALDFIKTTIEEQTFMLDGIPRFAGAEYIMHWKNNPFIFLPSWSVEPFSRVENFKDSLTNGTNINGYKILLARMHAEVTKTKKELGILKWLLGGALVGIIIYAFMG